jgi:hypothetical protein
MFMRQSSLKVLLFALRRLLEDRVLTLVGGARCGKCTAPLRV